MRKGELRLVKDETVAEVYFQFESLILASLLDDLDSVESEHLGVWLKDLAKCESQKGDKERTPVLFRGSDDYPRIASAVFKKFFESTPSISAINNFASNFLDLKSPLDGEINPAVFGLFGFEQHIAAYFQYTSLRTVLSAHLSQGRQSQELLNFQNLLTRLPNQAPLATIYREITVATISHNAQQVQDYRIPADDMTPENERGPISVSSRVSAAGS